MMYATENTDTIYGVRQERVWTDGGQLTTIDNNTMKVFRYENAKFLEKRNNPLGKWRVLQECH